FVPTVVPSRDSITAVVEAGHVWDLTRWMPGTADFHSHPTPAKLANACATLAALHRTWGPAVPGLELCPAVARRLDVFAHWNELPRPAHPLPGSVNPKLADLLRRGRNAVSALARSVEETLRKWKNVRIALQPCL